MCDTVGLGVILCVGSGVSFCNSGHDSWPQVDASPVGLVSVCPGKCTARKFDHITHPSKLSAPWEGGHGPGLWEERCKGMRGPACT